MSEENNEDEGLQGDTPRRHNLLRIGKLTNLRQIAIECGRLYRRAEQREAEVINDKLAAAARAFAKSIV